MKKLAALCLFWLFAPFSSQALSATEEAGAAPQAAPPLILHLSPGADWQGGQSLAADNKGRLYLLRMETLEVHPLSAEGALGPAVALGADKSGLQQGEGPSLAAAMSGDGDWLIRSVYTARLFREGKEVALPAPKALLTAATFARDEPLLVGHGFQGLLARYKNQEEESGVPWVVGWGGRQWETRIPAAREEPEKGVIPLLEQEGALALGTGDGRLWMGFSYRHEFREYSAGGRLLTTVTVGKALPEPRADAAKLQGRAAGEEERLSRSGRKTEVMQVTARRVTFALTEGRDGKLYFLVQKPGNEGAQSFALERFDPIQSKLERLSLPNIPFPGYGCSLAAGRDGLYLAAQSAKAGIWKLDWERLEAGAWEPVEGVAVQGIPEPAPEASQAEPQEGGAKPAVRELPNAEATNPGVRLFEAIQQDVPAREPAAPPPPTNPSSPAR